MISLRPYQTECVDSIFKEFEEHNSTLAVLATGLGKSVIFTETVRRFLPKRSIIVAHRSELIHQAREHLRHRGIESEIEMAGYKANHSMFGTESTIVASVQTLISGIEEKRMEKFRPNDFSLLVVDEVHHAVSSSYKAIINHFRQNPNIKILGVTATPDRTDEEALGQIFESVAFDYEIPDGINDGWLVDIEQQMVHITGLDYSSIRTTAGDLNGGDLEAVMLQEKPLQGMVGATIDKVGDKKTIFFAASVAHAEKCCDIFNRHKPRMATFVCGTTPEDDREKVISDFKSYKVSQWDHSQVLVNVGVATEGFDCPNVEVIAMGRPTKSRALYSQCCGRGTRPLPRTVDGISTAEDRKEAIERSAKKSLLVMDFCGNSGRHKLITTADILGGKYSEEVVELAERKAAESGRPVKMSEALEESEKEIQARIEKAKRDEEARKTRLVAQVKYVTKTINPFDVFDITPVRSRGWDQGKQLSLKQKAVLHKMGVNPDEVPYAQGKQLLAEQFRRWGHKLCTLKQANLLKKHGFETKDMTMKQASQEIDRLAKNGWRREVVTA